MHPLLLLTVVAPMVLCEEPMAVDGGFSKQNPAEYTSQAWKSVSQINAQNNGDNYLVPIKVISAQSQVVAGTNTELEVLVGESTCQKGGSIQISQISAANCQVKQGGSRALYKVSILEVPWENIEKFTVEKIRNVDANENF